MECSGTSGRAVVQDLTLLQQVEQATNLLKEVARSLDRDIATREECLQLEGARLTMMVQESQEREKKALLDLTEREQILLNRERNVGAIRKDLSLARALVADRAIEMAEMQKKLDEMKRERDQAKGTLGKINSAFPGLLDATLKKLGERQ